MDSIDRLRKKLYSRSGKGLGTRKRRRLRELSRDVDKEWEPEPLQENKGKKKDSALTWLLIISVLFFVFSIAISTFFFFAERNTVSSANIDIEIQGPANIKGGEELVLQFVVTNKNPTAITNVDLLIEYPEGTRAPNDISEELARTREELNTLKSGGRIQKTARARLFGEEGSKKLIKATIEYRIEGSNAIFFREQTYEVTLSNSPLTLAIESVEEISSGQEVEFTLRVNSNSESLLEDILLIGEYPFGFEFLGSTPQPFAKNNVWELGDIKPEASKIVKVRGRVLGEDAEERVFRFSTGIRSKRDETKIETAFITALQTIFIEKPFIGVEFAINGDTTQNPIIDREGRVRVDITWFSNLPDKIFDGEIEVKLSGAIIDERSISVQNGFYRSSDNTVMWNRETLASLSTLKEGDRGTVSFSFLPIVPKDGESFRTPSIFFDVTIQGKRVSERNVSENIESTIQRVAKVATDLQLFTNSSYFSGPFQNTGPIPPRAEQETTYTVTWVVQNSTNPVGGVTVFAALPSYMRWVESVSPSNAQIDFNEVGGTIRWNVGTMGSHDSREVSFQVALSPSLSQVGGSPTLISGQRVEGIDTFTTVRADGAANALTAALTGELSFPANGGKVTE